MTWVPQPGFNYGQLSASGRSLIGTVVHELGSTLLHEGIVVSDGSLQGRPGTFLAGAAASNTECKMIPFDVRGDRPYVFEVTNLLIRVWDVNARVLSGDTFVVPFVDGDLPTLQFAANPDTLVITSVNSLPQLFHKSRSGAFEHREIDSSLIIALPVTKDIRLRTDQEPGFDVSFKVFSGPDNDEDAFFIAADVEDDPLPPIDGSGAYFRIEDGWIYGEARTSAFEITSDYLDSPPPFAITTTDWVGPFTGDGLALGPAFEQIVLYADDNLLPGDLIEIRAEILSVQHVTAQHGIEVPGFFRDEQMGGMLDLNGGPNATVITPDTGDGITQADGPGHFVVQLYDVRDGGRAVACRVVRVEGGSLAAPRFFTRGPVFFTPDLRDVPNTIIQPSGLANDILLYSNMPIFGVDIRLNDVVGLIGGSVRITDASLGGFRAAATVLDPLDGLWSTDTWGLGINSSTGFPRACGFHQDSLFLGGIPDDPGAIFKSRTADYEDFRRGANPTDGMRLAMTSPDADSVQWIRSMSDLRSEGQGILAVGTDSAEFTLIGSISPTEGPSATPISFFGSRSVQPISAGTSLLFTVDSGKSMRDLRLHQNVEHPAQEISFHAPDQFKDSPPRDLAYVREPYGLMVVVKEDGSVTSCSYRRDLDINAWIPWPSLKARSVCSIKRPGVEDELWFAVERGGALYVEYMQAGNYLDGAVERIPPTSDFTGLDHLEGQTVTARSGGSVLATEVVTGGQISVVATGVLVTVGVPSICRLAPLPNERDADSGSSFGRTKEVKAIRVQVTEDSSAPRYKDDDQEEAMVLVDEETVWYQADGLSESSVVSNFEIKSEGGTFFEISGITVDYDVKDF